MPRRERLVNDASTTLNGALTSAATSVTVTDGSVFPAEGDYRLIVNDEIMLVTARATNVLTVVRGVDGTSAAAHSDTDTIKAVLTKGSVEGLANDNVGVGYHQLGGAMHKMPYRLLDINGNTLDSTDFSWVNQGGATVADTPHGGLAVTEPSDVASGGDWRLLTKTAPSTPYAVTAHMQFVSGLNALGSNGNVCSIGFRDSATSRFVGSLFSLGGSSQPWEYTNETTFNAIITNSDLVEIHVDNYWFRIIDDGTNYYFHVSPDGTRWRLVGWDANDHWLANIDQVFFGVSSLGEADKVITLNSFIEHKNWVPMDQFFDNQSLELNTDSGTQQDITPGFPDTAVTGLGFHAAGEGVASGTISADSQLNMSMWEVGSAAFSHASNAQDGAANSNDSVSVMTTTRAYNYLKDSAASSNPEARCDTTNNGNDLRLSWNLHTTVGETQGSVVMFGGNGLQTSVNSHSPSLASNGSTQGLTGVGFAPNAAIFFSQARSIASNFIFGGDHSLGIGFAVENGNQASCFFIDQDDVSTSNVEAYTSDSEVLTRLVSGGATQRLQINSWDSDGATVQLNTTSGGYTIPTRAFWFQLTSPADAAVINFDWPGTTGEQTFTFGFKPRFVVMASAFNTSIDTRQARDAGLAISCISETVQTCDSCISADNVSTTECQSVHSEKALKVPTTGVGTLWEADFVEFTDTGMTLNFTTVDATTKAIAIGFR